MLKTLDSKVVLTPAAAFVVIAGCFVYLGSDEGTFSGNGTTSSVSQVHSFIGRGPDASEDVRATGREKAAEISQVFDQKTQGSALFRVTDFQNAGSSTKVLIAGAESSGTANAGVGDSGRSLAAEFDWSGSDENVEQRVEVNPSIPGHSITSLGVRVAVEGRIADFSGEPKGLEFSVGPDEKTPVNRLVTPNEAGRGHTKGSSYIAGFSPEDALFRTKWGWAAYDAAKRVARESQ